MDNLVKLWKKPTASEIYMLAGWRQWADAGLISSGLPRYLINKTEAEKIGEIHPEGFYLFQIPGTHHLFRPQVQLEEGHRKALTTNDNEFYYTENNGKGLVIFLGEEPHLNGERYASAFFDAVEALGVQRVGIVGGVYGAMPYDKAREVSCVYSLPAMQQEFYRYAARFSDYEGGVTIGSYLASLAEARNIELFVFYAFVPAYDFSQVSPVVSQISIEIDFRAWYELMRRFNHMFGMDIDLSELEIQSLNLTQSMDDELAEIEELAEGIDLDEYMDALNQGFQERPFVPLGDMWERGLRDIFDDADDDAANENG